MKFKLHGNDKDINTILFQNLKNGKMIIDDDFNKYNKLP